MGGTVCPTGFLLLNLKPMCPRLDTSLPSEGHRLHTSPFNASKQGSWIMGRARDSCVPDGSLSLASGEVAGCSTII